MEEYKIRIYLIAEFEKNLSLSLDLESSKLITLKNIKTPVLKYIHNMIHSTKEIVVKPNSIEDYMMDEIRGENNINVNMVYNYIFPYMLEYIDDYIHKTYLLKKNIL